MSTQPRLRPITAEELPAFVQATALQFGKPVVEGLLAHQRAVTELDRTIAAVEEGGRIIGTAESITATIGMPGARPAPCAGLTSVGVHPARRRRGILGALMRRHLDDAHARGEAFAALYATGGAIYGRYGYAPAAPTLHLTIDTAFSAFRRPAADVAGIDLVDPGRELDELMGIYDRAQARTPGMMSRPRERWEALLAFDPPAWREGFAERLHAVLPGRGYVQYRLKGGWEGSAPDGTLRIVELVASDPEASAALWRFCLDMDLVAHVEAELRPADDPLALALVDPPRLRARWSDPLHLRIVSLADAVAARGWTGADGGIVAAVSDAWCPWNAGTWRIDAGSGGAVCERVDTPPDLQMDIAELGAAFLGGVRMTSLVRARRVVEHREGAARHLDRLLASDPAPWNPRVF